MQGVCMRDKGKAGKKCPVLAHHAPQAQQKWLKHNK